MKKTLALLAVLAMATSAFAQGKIQLFGVNEIKRPDGTGASDGYTAGLFLASDPNTVLGTTTFITGTGFMNGVDVTIPGFAVGSTPLLVVRAWETGKTYATSTVRGEHVPFQAPALGGDAPPNPSVPPPDLGAGFTGFTMVPEPSSYALGVLGLGVLAMMRRRKA